MTEDLAYLRTPVAIRERAGQVLKYVEDGRSAWWAVDGNGLGLAICRAIIELHRGRIWAEERHPHGAMIRFTVPIGAEETERLSQDD